MSSKKSKNKNNKGGQKPVFYNDQLGENPGEGRTQKTYISNKKDTVH